MLGNLQNKIIQAVQSQLNNFFFFFSLSIHCHSHFCKFCKASRCVSVDTAFNLKCGFRRQGRCFETGSWFLRDVGLSPHLGL